MNPHERVLELFLQVHIGKVIANEEFITLSDNSWVKSLLPFLLFRPRLVTGVMFPVGGLPFSFPPLEDDRNFLPARTYHVDDVPSLCSLLIFSRVVVDPD